MRPRKTLYVDAISSISWAVKGEHHRLSIYNISYAVRSSEAIAEGVCFADVSKAKP